MILSYRIITNRLYANDYKVIHLPWMKIQCPRLLYSTNMYIVQLFIHIFDFFPLLSCCMSRKMALIWKLGPQFSAAKKKSEVHPVQKLNRWRHQVELKTKLWVQFSFGDSSESEQKQLILLKCNIRFF